MRAVRAFAPPRVTREEAALARILARRRVALERAGWRLRVAAAPAEVAAAWRFGLAIGGAAGSLEVPGGFAARLLQALDPAAAAAPADARALLLELALEPLLAPLEAALGATVALAPEASEQLHPLVFGLHCRAGDGSEAVLRCALSATAAAPVARLLAPVPEDRAALPWLPVTLHALRGAADLPLRELRAARPGDVILADTAAAGTALLATEAHGWRAALAGRSLRLLSPRLALRRAGLDGWTMSDETPAPPEDSASLDDDMQVRLVFELGRLELPLRELAALGPGHVFELPRDAAEPVDILANGRRIGRGEMVMVGDAPGVRILWLRSDG